MKNFLMPMVLSFLVLTAVHASGSLAQVQSIRNGIELNTEQLKLRIIFYSGSVVRITKWCEGGTADKLSLSVIKKDLPEIKYKVDGTDASVVLSSPELSLTVNKSTGTIAFSTPAGTSLLQEQGTPSFTPVGYFSDSGFTVQQGFKFHKDEGIYGFGEQTDGYFNFRGKKVLLAQANVGAVTSFFVSTQKYGILWDNYSSTTFEDHPTGATLRSDIGNNIDYYFVSGENMDSVIAGYRDLTGTAPMFGKWAFGYWQSKEHYENQAELMGVAQKYRRLKIPIDNIIQDWDYWNGAPYWSGMFFDKTLFPAPKEMCDSLHAMNFHIIISIWPALGPRTEIYKDMDSHGYLYSPVGWAGFKYYDAYNPAANELYWKYLKSGLYTKGLDGWWIDSPEPDVVNACTKASSEYELKKMGRNHLGSWARYLNAFSLSMTDDIYKNWRKETSERRLFILTRSTFAGQQRNAATTWSGDIGASWEIYRNQISAGVNHSMSGIPYWTFDIGAFVLGSYGGVFMQGGKDPAYQELYTRMFQFGSFTPIFRSHGSETPREIWEMGDFVEPIVKFDNLRYRLMPYIYSLSWKVTSQDYTIMRGLPMDFSADTKTHGIDDQFMFGPSMMVCPVTKFMYHRPPQASVLIEPKYFKTSDGKPGLAATYYSDAARTHLTRETIDPKIDFIWYTGRPAYLTDSTFAVTWQGKLIPKETGKHQFHLISFDAKRIILNGDTLKLAYSSTEQYTVPVDLKAGQEYQFTLEMENSSTGAAKMQLYWKTPSIFAKELRKDTKPKVKEVYLPAAVKWYDFWTGKTTMGGRKLMADAPIDKIPLFVRAGSIIPMGPFVQYAAEKPADALEIRIYPGANGSFTLYEDENDNYNYEKGVFSTIEFTWNDAARELTIADRKGDFPGMVKDRVFNVVIVGPKQGNGLDLPLAPNKTLQYGGGAVKVTL
jgi:alpha-D-xyloside xylohydrolase